MKPEKDVLGFIPSKNQGNAKRANPSSVYSPHNKNKKKTKKKMVMTWRLKKADSQADEITAVRRLFLTCQEVFSSGGRGVVPSEDKIQQLRGVLDNMKPEDVGLTPTIFPAGKWVFATDNIAIFWLPPSGVIPLHNHPGMTVFSKLLFGTMHIKSYDWVVDASTKTACAVLDVLGPPYRNPEGRHCTYFLEFPLDKFSSEEQDVLRGQVEKEGYAWLQERDDNPEDLNVVGALYGGPKFED
ncbi:hypothetical protein N665_0145s0038 [Sinapis alba]|nr:hypothetical protein N665_0145s0038 [Sinapis alba]